MAVDRKISLKVYRKLIFSDYCHEQIAAGLEIRPEVKL